VSGLALAAALLGALPSVPPAPTPAPPAPAAPESAPPGGVFHGRQGATQVPLPRQDATVTVDGRLDEPVWKSAATLTGFSQFFPTDGVAAHDSTEVLVWYSGTALHVGIRAFAPPGSVRATLADRDKISQDDNVQLFLGTYNDSRQALVFAVNPLGIQSDGVLTETGAASGGGFLASASRARETPDLAPDYVWQSKGRVTDTGYEVEMVIPFKSLRYRAADVQTWQLNVVRTVQATGFEETWTPARRASASFLTQSGRLTGLTNLQRGLTVDLIPTITSSATGGPTATAGGWSYVSKRPELGGSARWGVTSNLTLAATANPDFSQVEADATQYSLDPRAAVFYPERRPFFLESQEQFSTPNRLIYTRRLSQPTFATKLTGKHGGFDIGVLTALDDQAASATGKQTPLYNILRLQRDLGTQSRAGIVYTDRMEGDRWNRVLGVDGRLVRGVWGLQGQVARSFTGNDSSSRQAPLWDASLVRNGRAFYARYVATGISRNFDAQSGFIARTNLADFNATHRLNFFGKPGALVQLFSPEVYLRARYRYEDLVTRRPSQDQQVHLRSNLRFRGGWSVGAQILREEFGYDRDLYSNYVYLRPRTGGVDTVSYTGTAHLPNLDYVVSVATPEFKRFSYSLVTIVGQDENFQEWSSAKIVNVQNTLTLRPSEQLRASATWVYELFDRKSDGSRVLLRSTPRVRLEYQLTRQMFFRAIGEYAIVKQDSLRDDSRTNLPVYVRTANGSLVRQSAFERTRARLDLLFSYLPTPGTVFYVGYGDALRSDEPAGPRTLQRSRDVFFAKLSYLFRLQ
jgi:hypothetical protein